MKKILLVSDLHGQPSALIYLTKIIKKEQPSAIIICGDITSAGDISFFDKVENIINNSKAEGFIVWGNSDLPNANQYISQSKYSIHLKTKRFNGFRIFGLSETDDPVDISQKIKGAIFITHKPPLKSFLNKNLVNAPLIHISGHLHNVKLARRYQSTLHISVPTLQNGSYALLYPESKKVEFLEIN